MVNSNYRFKKKYFGVFISVLLVSAISLSIFFNSRKNNQYELLSPSLKELAATKNIALGNFAIRNYLKNDQYDSILKTQFDFALADNTPNWYFTDGGMRPSRDEFYFDHMDEVVKYARDNKMQIQAHHLLWGEEKWLPQWLKDGDYSQDELKLIVKNHIETVVGRYKGQIKEWTVVNESFSRGIGIYGLKDWWKDAFGDFDYVSDAFRIAKQVDPDAKLIINDFSNEGYNQISEKMYEYLVYAKENKIPIDGVGMQMHIDGKHPTSKEEVVANMKRFTDLGYQIYVTEFDVNMNDVMADTEVKDAIEGEIYYDMMRACIEVEGCKSFAFLGITDAETWYNYMRMKDPRPLMFDRNYQPKKAYFRIRDALSQPI